MMGCDHAQPGSLTAVPLTAALEAGARSTAGSVTSHSVTSSAVLLALYMRAKMQPALLQTVLAATPWRMFGSRDAVACVFGRHASGASRVLAGLTAWGLVVEALSQMTCDDCCSCCPDRTGHRKLLRSIRSTS
jgi:hypothetical protein